ncbi:helix-turn-helix domain-containing protein [Kineococcus rubinsiae]|uniref:helix-turn-helix domain-containing protein n=1 Tax=Kineococcus rubinsiae TaxID=2609562 RepID=UPI001AD8CFB8|nr:helix-turn-helix domain-containing protein [Kineococcus rubinsiae]
MEPVREYVRRRAAPALRPWVAGCSGYREAGVGPVRHLGLPSPWMTLILTLDDPLVVERHPDPAQPGGRFDALVGGLHRTPAVIVHDGRQSGIQVALHPLAARAVLGLPAGELAALDVGLDEVAGADVERVRADLLAAPDWAARFDRVEAWLAARLAVPTPGTAPRSAPEVVRAWELLRRGARVEAVAREVGWSARHLSGRFRTEVGLSPSALARVSRFDRTRRALQAFPAAGETTRPRSLADVAAEHGYADHAHLDRDFREFAQTTPRRWLAQEFRSVQDAEPSGAGRSWT